MSLPAPAFPTCFALMVSSRGFSEFLYLRGGQAKSEEYVKFGLVGLREALTSSMNTRFYLVPSREHGDEQLVHIKSSYNNKYLVSKKVEWKLDRMMGTADEPNEKMSESCTLFKIKETSTNPGSRRRVRFMHPSLDNEEEAYTYFASIFNDIYTGKEQENINIDMEIIDVSDQIILPPYVSFKFNGSYLKLVEIEGHPYLEFASKDKTDKSTHFTTLNYADGNVCIKSESNGKLLANTQDWIWADSAETETFRDKNIFSVSKIGDFFVLRSLGNKLFCTASKKGNRDCLHAGSPNITDEAKLALEEPILSREIYNIQYHKNDHARVYDTKDMNMATATAINESSKENTVKSTMSISTTKSDKHESTTTHKGSVSVKGSAGFSIGKVGANIEVQVGYEGSKAETWGDTKETAKKQDIEYQLTVPAKKKVTLTVTATQIKCDVPFSYTQRDKMPNGDIKVYNYDDGLYTGMDCFDLRYTTKEEDIDVPE